MKVAGKFRGVQPHTGGRVVLRFADKQQLATVNDELRRNQEEFMVNEKRRTKPTFTLAKRLQLRPGKDMTNTNWDAFKA